MKNQTSHIVAYMARTQLTPNHPPTSTLHHAHPPSAVSLPLPAGKIYGVL